MSNLERIEKTASRVAGFFGSLVGLVVPGAGLLGDIVRYSTQVKNLDEEIEADTMSLKIMDDNGHDLNKAIMFIEKMSKLSPAKMFEESPGWINSFRGSKKRLENAKSIASELK